MISLKRFQVLARVPSAEVLSRTTAAAGVAGQPGAAAAYAARLNARNLPSNAELAAAVAAGTVWNQSKSSPLGSGSSGAAPPLTLASRPLDAMGLYHFTAEDYNDGIGRCAPIGPTDPALPHSLPILVFATTIPSLSLSCVRSLLSVVEAQENRHARKQIKARLAVDVPFFRVARLCTGTTTGCSFAPPRTRPSPPNSRPQAPRTAAAQPTAAAAAAQPAQPRQVRRRQRQPPGPTAVREAGSFGRRRARRWTARPRGVRVPLPQAREET